MGQQQMLYCLSHSSGKYVNNHACKEWRKETDLLMHCYPPHMPTGSCYKNKSKMLYIVCPETFTFVDACRLQMGQHISQQCCCSEKHVVRCSRETVVKWSCNSLPHSLSLTHTHTHTHTQHHDEYSDMLNWYWCKGENALCYSRSHHQDANVATTAVASLWDRKCNTYGHCEGRSPTDSAVICK